MRLTDYQTQLQNHSTEDKMRTETIEKMMEGVKEVFAHYDEKIVETAINTWFSDVRYCSSPDTELKPLTFAEHLEIAEKKSEAKKERDEENRKRNEAEANLSLAERVYGVTIDSFGNKTKPLSLGS